MAERLKPERKTELIRLAWPLFVEMMLVMVIGNVATMMLAAYSDDAAGSISVANQLIAMFHLVFMIISVGTGILSAQYIGAKRSDLTARVGGMAITVAILIGAIGTAVMFLFGKTFLVILNLEGTFLVFGQTYISIVASVFVLQAVAFSMSQIIFSHGYTKVGMMASLVANVVNLILNYVLIFGVEGLGIPSLGVAGAAISVLGARIVYFLLLALFLFRSADVSVSFRIFRPFPKQILRDILRIGLPSTGENISYTGSQLIITSFVAAIGAIAITTKTYYETVAMFSWAVSASVASATTIMVGHLTGAGDADECDRVVRHSLKISLISTAVVMTIFVFAIGSLVRLFTDNPEIILLAKTIVWIDVGLEMGRAVNMVVGTSLKSAGDIRYPFYVAVAVQWTVMIAAAYLLGIVAGLGLAGIWIAIAADEMIRSIVLFSRWASGKWRSRALIRRASTSK